MNTDPFFNFGALLRITADSTKQSQIFDLSKKVSFFYKECIVYPYVSMNENKKGYILLNTHLTEILNYVEEANFGHL